MALFRQCSSCRTDIACGAVYWVCSVSTCTRKRTGLFFCSVPCWEAHLPSMRHREAWAVEKRAPNAEAWARELAESGNDSPRSKASSTTSASSTRSERRTSAPAVTRRPAGAPAKARPSDEELERDILIVASKLKKYIRARSGMNTSDSVLDPLSDCVRSICDKAIRIAGADGRRTVMDRDVRAVD